MQRRGFLRLAAGLPAVMSASLRWSDAAEEPPAPAPLSDLDRFNYVLGTQAIGATYQFTQEPLLVEMAQQVLGLGSNLLKLTLGRGYERMMLRASKAAYPETMQYLLNQGSDAQTTLRRPFPGAAVEAPPSNPAIGSLVDLARLEPAYRRVFAMPFAYYVIWTYAFTPTWWHDGFSKENQDREYREMYDLVTHLLESYRGTGKTFLLGHWEGDWHLRPNLKIDTDVQASPKALQGMTDWLNVRQRAVDDAKRQTPHEGVEVYHYTEVNHVTAVSMAGRASVTNRVLPNTNVDYVSYSSYDSLADIPNHLPKALDYLAAKLPAKSGIAGKRVFIGEYGFPARMVPEAERDRRSRQVMRAGLEWGCPFVLSWQMYNNEFAEGQENGYWLIDDQGVKQPLYHTHQQYFQAARRYVAEFQQRQGRLPSREEFARQAVQFVPL